MNVIETLYSSERLLAIHKPPGVPFHQEKERDGILTLLRSAEGSGDLPNLGPLFPVHRLDAITSGVLLFARDRQTARLVSDAFATQQVTKLYIALSAKRPKRKQGLIVGDMARSRRGAWKLLRSRENPARTRFLTRSIPNRRPGLRLYLLQPETGRTHQLRVAMKSLGAPVLGDPSYGNREEAKLEERAYLHACGLQLRCGSERVSILCQPASGEEFCSAEFAEAWESLVERWEDLFPKPKGALP